MIGPLLRVAAGAAAARSLRVAVHDAATRVVLTLGAAAAVAVGAAFFTGATFILLERQLDAAAACAVVGAFWGITGLLYFVVARRRRG